MTAQQQRLELTASDGTALRGRWWRAAARRAALFYVHGIQSHTGWLSTTAAALNARGVDVVAFDRRGSGESDGERGDAPGADTILDDQAAGLALAKRTLGSSSITVVGQSFGGSVAAALAARGDLRDDHLVLCAPALGQQRHRLGDARLDEVRRAAGDERTPLTLKDEDYTTQREWLDFIAGDPLMVRSVTARMRAAMVGIEDIYMDAPQWPLTGGADLVLPEHDAIIALDAAEAVIRARVPDLRVRSFAARAHYLEFEPSAPEYIDWLADRAIEHAG